MKKQRRQRKKEGVKASEIVTAIAAWYFRFKLFFFFFPSPADFLFPAETHRYSADTIRFGPNRRESAHVGAYRETTKKKKLDVVRCAGSGVPHVSPPRTRVRWPICRVYASQLQCKIYIYEQCNVKHNFSISQQLRWHIMISITSL